MDGIVNVALLVGVLALIVLALLYYFSPRALRRLAAWCEGRAAGMDHARQIQAEAAARLGVTRVIETNRDPASGTPGIQPPLGWPDPSAPKIKPAG